MDEGVDEPVWSAVQFSQETNILSGSWKITLLLQYGRKSPWTAHRHDCGCSTITLERQVKAFAEYPEYKVVLPYMPNTAVSQASVNLLQDLHGRIESDQPASRAAHLFSPGSELNTGPSFTAEAHHHPTLL